MDMTRRAAAEFFGTFWLTFGGCGAAVLAAGFPSLGIGFLGVAFAFGLTVLTMAYAVGHISGGHFNPAVTLGLWSAQRCANRHVLPYIIAQVIGAILSRLALSGQRMTAVIQVLAWAGGSDHGRQVSRTSEWRADGGASGAGEFVRARRGGSGACGASDACGLDQRAHR
jgi:glycerol uptake facilitator-like aquaporin